MGLTYSCAKKDSEPLVTVTIKSSCCNKKKMVFNLQPDKVDAFIQDVVHATSMNNSPK
jgi:hypothetical protein